MILRKPYAFFIRHFKIIHIILSLMIVYLLYKTGIIVNFFNDYLNSTTSVVGQELVSNLFSSLIIIIPIIIILVSGFILGVMFNKGKPYVFYMVNIFIFVATVVLLLYSRNFIVSMESSIMNIKSVKLTHDLMVIAIGLESFSFIILLARGLGLNFKKFDFSSDLMKMDIDEKDEEEVEISINVDVNEKRRLNRRKLRYLKYRYAENKFIINISILFLVFIVGFVVFYRLYIYKDSYSEGILISLSGINIGVEQSYLLKEDEENYLIAVEFNINSNIKDKTLLTNDLVLKIENYKILPTKKYCSNYTDLGICYSGDVLTSDLSTFLMFYEVPKIYYESNLFFHYITLNDEVKIKINPIKITEEKNIKEFLLGDILVFEEKTLSDISFSISSYDISNSFPINYNYCYKDDDCLNSIEYLKPTINSNFDKTVLKLNLNYESDNKTYNTFYKLFDRYGSLSYKINGKEYIQKLEFEELKSSKKIENNVVYISVISDVLSASEVKIEFNVRNNNYVYILKGE